MRYAFLWASILVAGFGWAVADEPNGSRGKAEDASAPTRSTISGTVVSASEYILAIETQAGNRMEFDLGSGGVLPAATETGTQVTVSYGPGETGVSHVLEVTRFGDEPRESDAATPSEAGTRRSARLQPIRYEPSERRLPLPAVVLIGVLGFGVVVGVGILARKLP